MTQTSGASPSAEKPFFRYDLHTTPVEEAGQRFVDVRCPDTGSSFRFFEVEYAVACGMDGERGLTEIVDWAQSELDLRTDTSEVGAIVSKLNELNFVEVATPVSPATAPSLAAPSPSIGEAALGLREEALSAPAVRTPAPPIPLSRPASAPLAAQAADLEVELGQSGRSPLRSPRPAAPEKGDDLELGLPGASTLAPERPAKPAELGIELGAAGFDENEVAQDFAEPSRSVSTDLSQTFRIGKGDVQAAVRASKVMAAVEIPEDLKEEMEDLDFSEPPTTDLRPEAFTKEALEREALTNKALAREALEREALEREALANAALSPGANDDLEFQIGEEAKTSTGREAIVLPEEPAQIAKREAAEAAVDKAVAAAAAEASTKQEPVAKERSASLLLWLVLLVVVGAAAVYYYMEYVRPQPGEVGTSPAAERADQKRTTAQPATVAAPLAKLAVSEPSVAEAKAGLAGIVDEVVAPGTEVAVGDALVKLKGYERYQREIEQNQSSLDRYATRLEAAKASGETAKAAELERNVKRKEGDVADSTAKRDAYFVKAEMPGVAEVLVDPRARVQSNQTVAKVSGQATATATFTLPAGVSAALGDELKVVDAADSELSATCKVSEVAGQEITLSCPADSGLVANTELALQLE